MHDNSAKRFSAWLGYSCVAWASLAQAEAPPPNAQALGVAESALNYCAPLDPAAAERIRQMIKLLVQGVGDQQLAEVRQSDQYRKAYESVADFTAKIDPHNTKQFCAEASERR